MSQTRKRRYLLHFRSDTGFMGIGVNLTCPFFSFTGGSLGITPTVTLIITLGCRQLIRTLTYFTALFYMKCIDIARRHIVLKMQNQISIQNRVGSWRLLPSQILLLFGEFNPKISEFYKILDLYVYFFLEQIYRVAHKVSDFHTTSRNVFAVHFRSFMMPNHKSYTSNIMTRGRRTLVCRFNYRLIQSGFSHVFGVYSEPIEIAWG